MFYESPDNKECCCISYSLKRKSKLLLRNTTSECFSAGFRVGEFSNPTTLALKIKITFPNKKMQHAFIGGLKMAGYHKSEYASHYKTVTVHFTKPHTTQPASRTGIQEAIIQQGNRASCQKYSQLTSKHTNTLDKLELCSRVDSDLYNKVLKSLYSKELYSNYELISPILKKLAAMNDYEVLNSSSL
jgi:Domain of unknown function (DUF4474)